MLIGLNVGYLNVYGAGLSIFICSDYLIYNYMIISKAVGLVGCAFYNPKYFRKKNIHLLFIVSLRWEQVY